MNGGGRVSKSQHAVEQFGCGLNCAQAVVGEYAEDLGTEVETAWRIACGFGGGMGRSGGVCGAVTGAIMVLGLASCGPDPRDSSAKTRTYDLVRSFIEAFETRHHSIVCRELLGCDIGMAEGHAEAQRSGLFQNRCPRYVEDAVEILEDIL